MEFRKATLGDTPALVELRKQQLIDEGLPFRNIDSELRDYFSSAIAEGSFIAWLALENGSIVATSGLCLYRLPPSFFDPAGVVAHITNMFTAKPYRRKGLAAALLTKILDEARTAGASVARLHSSADGKPLYQKFGFSDSSGYMALKF